MKKKSEVSFFFLNSMSTSRGVPAPVAGVLLERLFQLWAFPHSLALGLKGDDPNEDRRSPRKGRKDTKSPTGPIIGNHWNGNFRWNHGTQTGHGYTNPITLSPDLGGENLGGIHVQGGEASLDSSPRTILKGGDHFFCYKGINMLGLISNL